MQHGDAPIRALAGNRIMVQEGAGALHPGNCGHRRRHVSGQLCWPIAGHSLTKRWHRRHRFKFALRLCVRVPG
jgi:hypothetical protein